QQHPTTLLIPGVGTQGGSVSDTLAALDRAHFPVSRIMVNASSSVLFAHEKNKSVSFGKASAIALSDFISQLQE
ncbi:MAG: hypothetical protein Q7R47_04275, partial [Candidatus Diapherotrites archaeon]|nr:hypothetical protein [Candidatus Diapherotrites archaeon]